MGLLIPIITAVVFVSAAEPTAKNRRAFWWAQLGAWIFAGILMVMA